MDRMERHEVLKACLFETLRKLPEEKWCVAFLGPALFETEFDLDVKLEIFTGMILSNLAMCPSQLAADMVISSSDLVREAGMAILLERKMGTQHPLLTK